MRRGEVWWAEMEAPAGPRPVVLVSRDAVYQVRGKVTIAPITTRIRGIRTEVKVGPADRLRRQSVVDCDNLATIPKAWLKRRMGLLSPAKLHAVNDAIKFALELP